MMSDPDSGGEAGSRERSDADKGTSSPGELERAAKTRLPSEILSRLVEASKGKPRYRIKGEIARGGMGAVFKVWDDSLDRSLAMKVIVDSGPSSPDRGRASPAEDPIHLARFLEEAQVTGQLDHPGVVPVHELGLDADGRVFFTMKLVKGRDLKAILDLVFAGTDGWTETRALGVILKVCEAMAYAHAKGVIHRDLKPANVMVGDFGEVYVMDWGLARVRGNKDAHDLRLRPDGPSLSSLKTERRRERDEAPDSPLITMDGDVVGTPAYMPLEQARGDIESLGPRSDVYSIGAMLYHLLARQMPYVSPGARVSTRTLLAFVLAGPPKPLYSIRRDVPAELVAIVEKAMAREGARRYATTLELADDLRAYVENRVVKAYETGPVAELRKWVVRNKPLAATIAGAVLALIAAIFVINDARVRARIGQQEVLRLSDVKRLEDLETEAASLWPADPANSASIDDWLARARILARRLPLHRERLAALRDGALPWEEKLRLRDRESHPDAPRLVRLREERTKAAESLATLESEEIEGDANETEPERVRASLASTDAEIARLESETARQRTWRFAEKEDEWQHGLIAGLVEGIESLTRDDAGWSAVTIAALERRLEFAKTVERRTIDDEKAAWDAAIANIEASDKYDGLELVPQMGLVPLGSDPASGLWEFLHVQSGERPARGDDGVIMPREDMGIVLVLIPRGTFAMGSPESEAGRLDNEGPRHDVTLEPYFISKYELTQGQWGRFAGRIPSGFTPPGEIAPHAFSLLNPVEQVSWEFCSTILAQMGLELPTEAQWELAARGGTSTPWWSGVDKDSLRNKANIADEAYAKAGGIKGNVDFPRNDDGHAVHAPVGTFPANPFGLHEVAGNVWEWCRDWYGHYRLPEIPSNGERVVAASERKSHVMRGGSFDLGTSFARSASRSGSSPEIRSVSLGVRPARRVTSR